MEGWSLLLQVCNCLPNEKTVRPTGKAFKIEPAATSEFTFALPVASMRT